MNAIVEHENAPRLPALQSGGTVRAIVPQDFDGAWRIANAVVKAGMAPRGLDTPEKAMVAIMHGLEVGFTPMASLQSIAVINSRATIWGDGALGLVQASGKMESHKEWFEGDGDDRKAFCKVIRKGDPEPKIGEFSVADAKKAKLWSKQGPWSEYSDRMLKMRARAFALRDGFSDVLKGLGIAEEVRDTPPRDINAPVPPKPPAPPSDQGDTIDAETGEVIDEREIVTETGESVDAVTDAEPIDYGDYFERLQEALQGVSDEAGIEEVWVDFDPEATFQDDEDSMKLALIIKERRLAAIHPLNSG